MSDIGDIGEVLFNHGFVVLAPGLYHQPAGSLSQYVIDVAPLGRWFIRKTGFGERGVGAAELARALEDLTKPALGMATNLIEAERK